MRHVATCWGGGGAGGGTARNRTHNLPNSPNILTTQVWGGIDLFSLRVRCAHINDEGCIFELTYT